MPAIETRLATESAPTDLSKWERLAEAVLSRLLPAANPNFDSDAYERVRRWWIDIDPVSHRPEREIGFDDQGKPVVVGPLGPNLGFWTDSDMTFDPDTDTPVAAEDFEQAWAQAVHQIVKIKGLTPDA